MVKRTVALVGVTFLVVAVIIGCGGGGGGGGGVSGAASSSPTIVAGAGPDMDGPISSSIRWIRLDGSGCYDKGGLPITYTWTQTAGTAVTLLYSNTAYPIFAATATAGNLTFQVTADNGTDTASDSITVSIKNFATRAGIKLADETTLATGTSVVATKNFTTSGNFNTAGVLPGDTLFITQIDNPDFGEYYINSVNSNISITVQNGKNFEGSVPTTWAIYRTEPYFYGYNKAGTFTAFALGVTTGTISYSWSSTPSFMVTSGSTTSTLTFTSPRLDVLTTLPEQPGVLGLHREAVGRVEGKVTITDDMGTPGDTSDDISDYEYINYIMGHLTTGLENVPMGEPVFMNGGTTPKNITSSTWLAEAGAVYTYSVAETSTVRSLHEEEDNMPYPIVQAASLAQVEAIPGSWYQSAAGARVYIHSIDNGNPTTNGLKYRFYITDSWTWTGYDPEGTSITFYRPDKTALGGATDERTPYFMANKRGNYTVTVTRALTGYSPATDIKTFTINAGQYAGVGSQVEPPADPTEGECGGCHGGSVAWLDDKVTEWSGTGHSMRFKDSLTTGYSADDYSYQDKPNWREERCMLCHAVGTSFVNPVNLSKTLSDLTQPTSTTSGHIPNKGFDDIAMYRNLNLVGLDWDSLVSKYPDIAGKANIQCEACHGPGSEHVGDTAGIRKSMDPSVCARCHKQPQMWKISKHGNKVESPAGGSTCTHCHEAFGAMEAFEAVEDTTGPKTVFVDATGAPVLPDYQRRAITCAVCHNPHKKGVGVDGTVGDVVNPQLRIMDEVTFMNGVTVDAGISATCFMCHQSRKDTRSTSDYYTGRGSSHDSTAAEVLSKTNGMEYTGWTYYSSPHGIDTAFIVGGETENKKCITCHMEVTPSKGQSGYQALGDHTWNMHQGGAEGNPREVADETINTGGAVVAGKKSFIVTAGPIFIDKVVPGDELVLEDGTDAGTYMITAVDSGWKVTTNATSNFVGTVQPTLWLINSVPKYNTAACGQCHTVGTAFEVAARADYDGDGTPETVQEEVEGLLTKLTTAMESTTAGVGLNDPALPKFGTGTSPFTIATSSGKVAYKGANAVTRKFPGPAPIGNSPPGTSPGADATQQADWAALTTAQQTQYEKLYKAMYNWKFVDHDRSEGIHNTGYVIGLLQSSYYNLTGSSAGSAFTPIPGY